MLAAYVSRPAQFAEYLYWSGAIISGSTALHFCLNDEHWSPTDLDIYTTASGFDRCIQYLQADNYTIVGEHVPYGSGSCYSMVVKLARGSQAVNVIWSRERCASAPIAVFWSTIVMNGITSKGYFITYLKLTMGRRGLVNHTALINHRTVNHASLQCIFIAFSTGTGKPAVLPKRVWRVRVRLLYLDTATIPRTRTAVSRVPTGIYCHRAGRSLIHVSPFFVIFICKIIKFQVFGLDFIRTMHVLQREFYLHQTCYCHAPARSLF